MRDLIWWLLLGAIALASVGLFVANRVQAIREQEALYGPGSCEESVMVEAVRSYRTTVWAVALILPVLGICVSAALTRRLKPELYDGRNGTGKRLALGLIVAFSVVVVGAVLLFFLGGHCLRSAVSAEGGLPSDVASGISSVIGGKLVPNFWIASALETLLVCLLAFFLYARIFRFASNRLTRLGRG
jgi:hypothetical protein